MHAWHNFLRSAATPMVALRHRNLRHASALSLPLTPCSCVSGFRICFSCLPLSTFCCTQSSLISTKGGGIFFFTDYPLHKKIFDGFQRQIISEICSNDVMSCCSIEPALVLLMSSKTASSSSMTTNCCLSRRSKAEVNVSRLSLRLASLFGFFPIR